MECSVAGKVVILLCLETQRTVVTLFWLLTLEISRSCTHLFGSWRLAAGYLSFLKFSNKQGKNMFSCRSSDCFLCLYVSRSFYLCFNEYLVEAGFFFFSLCHNPAQETPFEQWWMPLSGQNQECVKNEFPLPHYGDREGTGFKQSAVVKDAWSLTLSVDIYYFLLAL